MEINQDVHNSLIFGLTTTNSPDSDGDGLPDGLELGLRIPLDQNATSTTNDTNGDGFNNFISDFDPPFYNTFDNFNLVPAISTFSEGDKSYLKLDLQQIQQMLIVILTEFQTELKTSIETVGLMEMASHYIQTKTQLLIDYGRMKY